MRRLSRMLAARRCATVATRFRFLADVDNKRQLLVELFLYIQSIEETGNKKTSIELEATDGAKQRDQ